MIIPVVLGAGLGTGLWLLAIWLAPPAPALRDALARLHQPHPNRPAAPTTAPDAGWAARFGRPATPALRALGVPTAAQARNLAIAGRDIDSHLAEKAALAVLGLLTPPLAATLLLVLGVTPDPVVPAVAAVGAAGLGFIAPDLRARAEARQRRRDFRHALSAFLDLVVVSLSGGAGVDSALADAVAVGRGWSFDQLRRALDRARLTRAAPWTTLARLGHDLDNRDLAELAASLQLAGAEGARIRASLATRARSLRTHLLADADADARAATERMGLPWGLLFLGFLAFLGYPALHQILTGL